MLQKEGYQSSQKDSKDALTLNHRVRLIYILAVTARRGLFAFSYSWASFEQKRGKVSAPLKGSDPQEAKPFRAVFYVIAAAWEHNKHTHATHHHILHHYLVSRRQATRLGGNEISPSPGAQRLTDKASTAENAQHKY